MKTFKKGLPLLAVVLGLGIFLANATVNKFLVNDEDEDVFFWILNDPDEPTLAESYEFYDGSLEDDCEGLVEICGIKAPKQDDKDLPKISSELEGRIANQNTDDDDVFLKPFVPKP